MATVYAAGQEVKALKARTSFQDATIQVSKSVLKRRTSVRRRTVEKNPREYMLGDSFFRQEGNMV